MGEESEQERYGSLIRELANSLPVDKHDKFNGTCHRDEKSGVVVCASKRYVNDGTHKVSGYVKKNGRLIDTLGDMKDIEQLKKTIGP